MRKIAIATAKGGVGKTTAAVNLGAGLARKGKRVLIIDCDPQGNVGGHFNATSEHTLSELITNGYKDVIIEVRKNLHVIPSGRGKLYEAQREITKEKYGIFRLGERLFFIENYGYDYIFCDFSPTDTLINRAALLFCDSLLIPVSSGIDAVMGARRYMNMAAYISKITKHKVGLFGVLINMYEHQTVISREINDFVRKKWGKKVFRTVIRKNVAIGLARIRNQTIFEYAPKSTGAKDFGALTSEVIKINKKALKEESQEKKVDESK